MDKNNLEDLGTSDPSLADGYISYYRHGEGCVMVVATLPAAHTYPARLNALRRGLQAYGFERRNITLEIRHDADAPEGSPYFIYFVAKDGELEEELRTFIEFIRQSRVMQHPLIVNMSWFDIKKAN